MSAPAGPPARWQAVRDASRGPQAAERVLALLQPLAPITLRARIQRSPNEPTTPTADSFWVEVTGPCPADELIWQLSCQLSEDPTDYAWQVHMAQDYPHATQRFHTIRDARYADGMHPLNRSALRLPPAPATAILVLPTINGQYADPTSAVGSYPLAPRRINETDEWRPALSLLRLDAARFPSHEPDHGVGWHITPMPRLVDRVSQLEEQTQTA